MHLRYAKTAPTTYGNGDGSRYLPIPGSNRSNLVPTLRRLPPSHDGSISGVAFDASWLPPPPPYVDLLLAILPLFNAFAQMGEEREMI